MATKNDISDDVQSLIGNLSNTAKTVSKEDLGDLAKMHSWCEALASSADQETGQAAPPALDQAKSLIGLLEAAILGEAEDANANLSAITEAVAELANLIDGGASSQMTNSTGEPADDGVQAGEATNPTEATMAPELLPAAEDTPPQHEASSAPGVSPPGNRPEADAPPDAAPSDGTAAEPQDEAAEPPYEQAPLKIDENELEFIKGFLEETGEHIEAIEAALLEVERAPEDSTHIDNLFRPFHTIKGMAGFLNLQDINRLTHEVETIMDQARKGKRKVTPGLIDLVFDVVDVLKVQVNSIASHMADPKGDTIPQPPVVDMIGKLRAVSSGRIEPEGREPRAGSLENTVGENLVEQGACAKEVVAIALDSQKKENSGKKTGEILVGMGAATPKQISQAIRPQTQAKAGTSAKATGDQSIRIDTIKLDGLVDMVGELVIAQTLVGASSNVTADAKLAKDVDQVGKIVRDVQELAMSMRMVPIGPTFQKMARVVRDVSRKAGKQVELTISGEETELDKNVIQQIGDPLVHMVRNSVDHGIESRETRIAAGKAEKGDVRLSAFHQGGNIVIEITDDGKGLDPRALIAKGIERGVVQPGEELMDQQAFALIFAPGFSMAQEVTDISGRGVGMDVVRRNIEQLRGKVDIASKLGHGSTFSIRLPLTLAIIDGMVIQVGTERFIIPTITIEQTLRPVPEQITTVQRKGEVLNVRGRLIPLIQLGALFGLTKRVDPCKAMVVIANCEDHQVGLVVEKLIGQQQVVIKTLGERFKNLKGIAGAAILGDGKVGLILENSGLAAAHAAYEAPQLEDLKTTEHTEPEQDSLEDEHQIPDADSVSQDAADQNEQALVTA